MGVLECRAGGPSKPSVPVRARRGAAFRRAPPPFFGVSALFPPRRPAGGAAPLEATGAVGSPAVCAMTGLFFLPSLPYASHLSLLLPLHLSARLSLSLPFLLYAPLRSAPTATLTLAIWHRRCCVRLGWLCDRAWRCVGVRCLPRLVLHPLCASWRLYDSCTCVASLLLHPSRCVAPQPWRLPSRVSSRCPPRS